MQIEENMDKELDVTLSREELLYLLFLLNSDFIVGIDPDPLDTFPSQQKALAFAHAERSLRARDLADLDENGNVVVREAILLMAGTCAFPEFLLAAHSFPSTGEPKRIFWNGRAGVIVAHERPEAPLHRLSFLKDRDNLLKEIIDFCKIEFPNKASFGEFQITNNDLKTIREQVKNSPKKAVKLLEKAGSSPDAAQEVCSVLSGEYVVIAFHSLVAQVEKEVVRESASLLVGMTSTWLLQNVNPETVIVKPIGETELIDLFLKWTSPADNWISIPDLP
jgi:hypothetical protein